MCLLSQQIEHHIDHKEEIVKEVMGIEQNYQQEFDEFVRKTCDYF